MQRTTGLLLIALLVTTAEPVWSIEPGVCRNPPQITSPQRSDSAVQFKADRAELKPGSSASFFGNVEVTQDNTLIRADQAKYFKSRDELEVSGRVKYFTSEGAKIETEAISLQPDANTGSTKNARFTLPNLGHGKAGLIMIENKKVGTMFDIQYTGCPEGQNDWYISASELDIDYEKDLGIAKHAVMRFQGIPIFYWPYFDFPLSGKRKSGVLAPVIGASDRVGTTFGVPYYFNIAPNMDNTLTPVWLSRRGLQFLNEFRYITERSSGNLDMEYLANDTQAGSDRSAAKFRHQQKLGSNWKVNVDLNWISDGQYLDDFKNNLALSSQTHLPERIALGYEGELFQFFTQVFGYQTIDEAATTDETPYSMLPQINLRTVPMFKSNDINYSFAGDISNFQREDSVNGRRGYFHADTSYPLRSSYGYIKPKVGFYYWSYDLSDTDDLVRDANFTEKESRAIGYTSLDSGLVFDRTFSSGKSTQTLEPRLFYLYVPYREQDNLPLFDTTLPDFWFASLFRENRFVGKDRVGDANQLTVALTSRFLDNESGSEYLSLSAGIINYFEVQRVTLAEEIDKKPYSDLAGEATLRLLDNWYLRSAIQWDYENKKARRGNTFLQYQPNQRSILSMGYRLQPNEQTFADEQVDLSFLWPAFDRWAFQGRWNHSLTARTNLETNLGIEYRKPCCWAFRLSGNRRLKSDGNQATSILIQLELTSLGKTGNTTFNPLKQSMFYED
ncbi:MAG: LPS-assembly protein LptD [Acidiferrobacterales bacterium]